MSFTPEQIAALKAPLVSSHVKQRSQAGRSLSYIEGWHAIDEANRIFGFDRWDRKLENLGVLGEPRQVEGKWRVAYMATVRICVWVDAGTPIVRDGTGYGSGIDKDLGQAHESAIKEAETDAMKRALMTFGNPFGLALYDKEQRNVVDEAPAEQDAEKAFYLSVCRETLKSKTSTYAEKVQWWNDSVQKQNRRTYLNQDEVDELKALLMSNAPKQKEAAE